MSYYIYNNPVAVTWLVEFATSFRHNIHKLTQLWEIKSTFIDFKMQLWNIKSQILELQETSWHEASRETIICVCTSVTFNIIHTFCYTDKALEITLNVPPLHRAQVHAKSMSRNVTLCLDKQKISLNTTPTLLCSWSRHKWLKSRKSNKQANNNLSPTFLSVYEWFSSWIYCYFTSTYS